MNHFLHTDKPIEVKTGDYRRQWMDAKITHVTMEVVGQEEDESPIYGLSLGVAFLGEDEGLSQHLADAFGWSKDEWRYKE